MLGDDQLRSTVQIASTRVITEPGPQVEHFVDRCRSERVNIGEPLHEALVVPDYGRDLRLLQHDLRHPHAIRGRILLPRQMLASRAIEPRKQWYRYGRYSRHTCTRVWLKSFTNDGASSTMRRAVRVR